MDQRDAPPPAPEAILNLARSLGLEADETSDPAQVLRDLARAASGMPDATREAVQAVLDGAGDVERALRGGGESGDQA